MTYFFPFANHIFLNNECLKEKLWRHFSEIEVHGSDKETKKEFSNVLNEIRGIFLLTLPRLN